MMPVPSGLYLPVPPGSRRPSRRYYSLQTPYDYKVGGYVGPDGFHFTLLDNSIPFTKSGTAVTWGYYVQFGLRVYLLQAIPGDCYYTGQPLTQYDASGKPYIGAVAMGTPAEGGSVYGYSCPGPGEPAQSYLCAFVVNGVENSLIFDVCGTGGFTWSYLVGNGYLAADFSALLELVSFQQVGFSTSTGEAAMPEPVTPTNPPPLPITLPYSSTGPPGQQPVISNLDISDLSQG